MRYRTILLTSLVVMGLSACMNRRDRDVYPVFFSPNSAQLSATAQTVVVAAAEGARHHHARVIEVIGHAAAGKNLSSDELLSVKRADVVAHALHAQNIGLAQIIQVAQAPAHNADAAVASRVVTIVINPKH